MPQSIYDNGGMIGVTLNFDSTEQYVIGTTTGRATPVYVGGTTSAGTGTAAGGTFSITSLTGGVGTAPEEGDIIIVAYAIGSTNDRNVTITMDGSTDVNEVVDIYSNDTVDANLGVYWAVATATPPTEITPGSTGSSLFAGALAVHVWRNIDTADYQSNSPLDVTTTTATAGNSALADPPSITTSTENAVVIAIGASGNDNATTPFTQGGDLSNFISIGGADTEDATVGMGSIATTTPATVDPAAFSIATATSYSWAAATVALRPKLVDVPLYGNFKNSGIWSLDAVLESLASSGLATDIEFVGSATGSTSISLTSLTGGSRSAAQANDFVLVVSGKGIDGGTTNNINVVGYTVISNLFSTQVNDDNLYMDVAYKYLTSADTSVSITEGVASIAFVFSGVSPINPLDVFPTSQLTNTVSVTPPAITPITDGSWVISAVGIGSDTNIATFSNATLSGTRSINGFRTHVGMAYYDAWTSGAYTPTGWSTNDGDGTGSGAAVTIALRPNDNSQGLFFDNFETYTGWVSYGSGAVFSQSSTQAYDGTFSLYKSAGAGGANGVYKTLPSTITTRGWTLSAWIFSEPGRSSTSDVIMFTDSAGDGYSVLTSGTTLDIDRRDANNGTSIASTSFTRANSVWYKIELIANLNNTFTASTYSSSGELLARVTSSSSTNYNSFDRVRIAAGNPYYIDNIRVS